MISTRNKKIIATVLLVGFSVAIILLARVALPANAACVLVNGKCQAPAPCVYSESISYPNPSTQVNGKPWSMSVSCKLVTSGGGGASCTSGVVSTALSITLASSSLASFTIKPASSTLLSTVFTATGTPLRLGSSTVSFSCRNQYAVASNPVTSTLTVVSPITSCSLSASSNTVAVGDVLTWHVTSTPAGPTIKMNGTKSGVTDITEVPVGKANATLKSTYSCAELGTYTRSAHIVGIVPAQGSCTTNAVTFTVTDPKHICAPPPVVCTDVPGFASSCTNPAIPSTQVVSITNPSATTTAVTFTVNANLPVAPTSSAVWNQGYYWSQSSNKWVAFTMHGTSYKGTTCGTPANGCWLTNSGSAGTISDLPRAAAKGDAVYLLTYDKSWVNGAWQGPACTSGTGSCWRLSVFPPNTAELMAKILPLTTTQDIISVARSAGYLVQATFKLGLANVVISQPLTHAILLAITQQSD